MKVHVNPLRRVWYDSQLRLWTMQSLDADGDQIGIVEYTASRVYAMRWWKGLLTGLAITLAQWASAATFEQFTAAIHRVETGGRLGAIIGDGNRARGPLQIHRGCWIDARMSGRYEDVDDLGVATEVLRRYLTRYARAALAAEDWTTCARIWNGGPRGATNPATTGYAKKVGSSL